MWHRAGAVSSGAAASVLGIARTREATGQAVMTVGGITSGA